MPESDDASCSDVFALRLAHARTRSLAVEDQIGVTVVPQFLRALRDGVTDRVLDRVRSGELAGLTGEELELVRSLTIVGFAAIMPPVLDEVLRMERAARGGGNDVGGA